MIKLSVIIPARNEGANVVHTFHSIMNCWEADGFDVSEIEVILVDNCSDDQYWAYPKPGDKGTSTYLLPRGAYWNRVLRVLYDPIAGNHSARNKGAKIARGEYLFFSDAHMSLRPGFFKNILKTTKESGGLVHGSLQFMGAYPPMDRSMGYGYTIKLGEEIKGTWHNYKIADTWFYVPAQGHWGVCVKKQQFLDFGGYPDIHRTYGGGEFYLDMKWWMFGSSVVVDPDAIGYHLASARGYCWNHDDYIHNVINIGLALGMDEWTERAWLNWCRKGREEVMKRIWKEAEEETEKDRKFIKKYRKHSFNEVLLDRPWERLNKEKHNYGLPNLLIFHDTWLDLLREAPQWVQVIYDNSEKQKGLEKFINENLSQFVYKRK